MAKGALGVDAALPQQDESRRARGEIAKGTLGAFPLPKALWPCAVRSETREAVKVKRRGATAGQVAREAAPLQRLCSSLSKA